MAQLIEVGPAHTSEGASSEHPSIIRIATWRQTNNCVLGSADEGRTGAYLGGGIVRASFIPRTASSSSSSVNRVMGSRCVRWWYASGLDGHSALAELLDCGSMV